MKSPRLNRRVVLEHPERSSNGSGGYTVNWQPLGNLWVQFGAAGGRGGLSAGLPVSSVSYRIVVRAAPVGAVDRPKPQQRFREGERVYYINAVVEDDPSGRFLTCFASEEVTV